MVFDGIIIGAGHHGLILGSYLAKAGLQVLLVERRLNYGGGLSTVEVTLPGFYHNLHSINHFHITETPWYRDLGLSSRVEYITPAYEFAMPLLDGRALVFGHSLDETVSRISCFSRKDAQTFREWNRKAERITREIFLVERFSEPLLREERIEMLQKTGDGRDFLAITERQPFNVVNELFESEHVKLMFLFKVSLFGTWLVDTLNKTSPMGSVIRAFDLETGYQLCRGGSANLARGLMETFLMNGGHYRNQANIARIIIEGGRATGIELSDGTRLSARHFLASAIDVHQTFEHLIGRDQLPDAYLRKLDSFKYTSWTLFGLHVALNEAPRYRAENFDSKINVALKYSIGAESLSDLILAHRDVEHGRTPSKINFGAGALTVLDPTQAPPGKHTAYAWHVMPYTGADESESAVQEEDEFADRIVAKWAEYAPNLTRSNILGRYIYTARRYTQHL